MIKQKEEGTYKQGKFLSNKFKPKGLRVDPVRGSAQGTKGGPGEAYLFGVPFTPLCG